MHYLSEGQFEQIQRAKLSSALTCFSFLDSYLQPKSNTILLYLDYQESKFVKLIYAHKSTY